MSKVTIAAAVIAGLEICGRLNELEVQDEKLLILTGNLARELANIQDMVEKVDTAMDICITSARAQDHTTVAEGLRVMKLVTEDLVSDQDKVMEAMLKDADEETKALIQLVSMLGGSGPLRNLL